MRETEAFGPPFFVRLWWSPKLDDADFLSGGFRDAVRRFGKSLKRRTVLGLPQLIISGYLLPAEFSAVWAYIPLTEFSGVPAYNPIP